MFLESLSTALGITHLVLVGIGASSFLYLIGCFHSHWDEPYPRVVQLAYSQPEQPHWFRMHCNKTALRKHWYVSSISQFVGARGTSGAKLMLLMTTSTSISSSYIRALLYCTGVLSLPSLILGTISSFGLFMLGFAESSLVWDPLNPDWPDLENPADEQKMDDYYKSLQITRLDNDQDDAMKSAFSKLHMFAAFTFIGFEFSTQMLSERYVVWAFAFVGLAVFVLFCILQWVTGANDDMLLHVRLLKQFAVVNWPKKLQILYFPQGGGQSRETLKKISFMFIGIEIIAFGLLASCPGWSSILSLP